MLTAIRAFFSRGDDKAQQLYGKLVAASRDARFYADLGVPDTVDGRYDMLVLHAVLLFCRLRGSDVEREFAQEVFDAMFADMDRGLREAGVGDLSVPKKIKGLARDFYGRAQAYDAALAAGSLDAIADVVARNVYRLPQTETPHARDIAQYAQRVSGALRAASFDDIREGRIALTGP